MILSFNLLEGYLAVTMAEKKKIALNFKGLPAATVQQIAAATRDAAVTPEERRMRQMRLSNYFNKMAAEHKDYAEMLKAGTTYLDEVEKSHQSLSETLDKLDVPPKRVSLIGRVLGKGDAAQRTLQDSISLMQSCQSAVLQIDSVLDGLHRKMSEQQRIYHEICRDAAMTGPLGPQMENDLHTFRQATEANARQFNELVHGSMNAKNNSAMLSSKASQIAIRQQMAAAQLKP